MRYILARDATLSSQRLAQFIRRMVPITLAFLLGYVGAGIHYRNAGLLVGAGAVATYLGALLVTRRQVRAERQEQATLTLGYALLVMVGIGIVGLPFLFAALLLIPLAGVALVFPSVSGVALRRFMISTMVTTVWLVGVGISPPLFDAPPLLFQRVVIALAAVTAMALTLLILWIDALRLRGSLEDARAAVRLRDEFLSIASHELNTPLTPLSLRLELLEKGIGRLADREAAERLSAELLVGKRQVSKLTSLVRDLLDVTRLNRGAFNLAPEPIDLVEVVRHAAKRFEVQAQNVGSPLELVLPPEPVGYEADEARLNQVLENLFSNAVKYGPGKPIRVELSKDGTDALIRVVDQGIGIDDATMDRLFGKFERGVSERNYGGLGLGLYISRQIVDAMGGQIYALSRPGEGAAFEVRLPLR